MSDIHVYTIRKYCIKTYNVTLRYLVCVLNTSTCENFLKRNVVNYFIVCISY